MAGRIRRTFSYANVTSTLALFAVMAGTSYAAVTLAKDSVGKRELKDNAVTSGEVKNGSLTRKDFAAGTLLTGPRGAKGDKGDQGVAGPQGCADGLVCPGSDLPNGGYVVMTIDEFQVASVPAYRIDCAATCTVALGGTGYVPADLEQWYLNAQMPPGPFETEDPDKKSFDLTERSQAGVAVRKFHISNGTPATLTHHNGRWQLTYTVEALLSGTV